MVECFHAITIDAKRLHFRYEQYCFILHSRNKSFPRNPFEFLHIRESLVSRGSRLDTRSSIVSSIEARGSSLEVRVSSVNLLLSGTVPLQYLHILYLQYKWSTRKENTLVKFITITCKRLRYILQKFRD